MLSTGRGILGTIIIAMFGIATVGALIALKWEEVLSGSGAATLFFIGVFAFLVLVFAAGRSSAQR